MQTIFIDAGIEHIHLSTRNAVLKTDSDRHIENITLKNNSDIRELFKQPDIQNFLNYSDAPSNGSMPQIYITGKLAEITRTALCRGETITPSAALWSAAKSLFHSLNAGRDESLGIIDLSASGYMVICIDGAGSLKDDLLITNPRCGAGTGINLNRILEKLDIRKDDVDRILADYLGERGNDKRNKVPVRSDRCGVFSSSATISDKNQGIPLDHALAVTMKSEVMKPCQKMCPGVTTVHLSGGVFRWQYARDCAIDFLKANGVKNVIYDERQSILITGMEHLVDQVGHEHFRRKNPVRLRKAGKPIELPSFQSLKTTYEASGIYNRIPDPKLPNILPDNFQTVPVHVGLDIGSTMAKIVIADAITGELLFHNSYNNHGDTIETVKHIFRKLKTMNIHQLNIQHIGITGSGRYQVQRALRAIYPHLAERIDVMVENYAHAWGSIQFAKDHIAALKQQGIEHVNEDFYLLIDIGGEDTKISVISLQKNELFDNAMNIKCSAGTGSLMDTLKALFNIENIADAYGQALHALKAYGINATCAVFLMENARKMQAEGYPQAEILASCCYAIVENMARSLWNQVEFPKHTIALLHGQTMLSDPLPLAVTHRLQEFMGEDTYCLVPPLPGHRACLGLLTHFQYLESDKVTDWCNLDDLIERSFSKKIIYCHGAACGDKNACCARTKLTSLDNEHRISLTLGGCTAVNELQARMQQLDKIEVPDAYRDIWKFIDNRLPKSSDKNRLVIPRSFAVSQKAFFFARIFKQFGIPVHVDNVQQQDIIDGQPLFTIDTCAPNIGTAGQFLRLAREPHGCILVPQIDFLPVEGNSLGRTCTTNQGGILIAMHFARRQYPMAQFKVFDVNLKDSRPEVIADQLYPDFAEIFQYYDVYVSRLMLKQAIAQAAIASEKLNQDIADITADFIEQAIDKKLNLSIISAREYILNPGIYDSHVGKLLKDKGVVAIPAYVFDIRSDNQFDYIYWKNPHDLMSMSYAISNKRFHEILKHKRLKKLIQNIETGKTESLMSIVTVSTFRCGPDSITLPVLAEVTKNMPTLLIQSDAMIAELAHLENRVNTHLNQLKKCLHHEFVKSGSHFSIHLLDKFSLNELNKETDVLYFPTAGDNRAITSVFRAAGITVIDNFDDDSFDLEQKAKIGRKYVGDSTCVPLAAVFADMLNAIQDFQQRKAAGDHLVAQKTRVVLFMHSGDGPCRMGQYIDMCKLGFYKNDGFNGKTNTPIRFLETISTSLNDKRDFLAAIDKWAALQAFHSMVVKGVLHAIYLAAGSRCRHYQEFKLFTREYRQLKQTVYQLLENELEPNQFTRYAVNKIEEKMPRLGGFAQYFGYGLYNNNGLRTLFRRFGDRWIRQDALQSKHEKVKIHVEGEIYLRVAQLEEIFKILVDRLGFGAFDLTYTPMWSFFEYILESRNLIANKNISMYKDKLRDDNLNGEREQLASQIKDQERIVYSTQKTIHSLRTILAAPLYRAAGVEMPHPMKQAISMAQAVLPKFKPFGELVPFVGETLSHISHGTDLVLNVAPEGCMVASMGEMLTPKMMECLQNSGARIQHLFTNEGEIDDDLLELSLLKILGTEKYYTEMQQTENVHVIV
ncbi:hypothetical protein JW960_13990 [candidate division KSB1 bacterium]|nr:hypothetical protein [candidate division KSB1 bacterium]